MCKQVVIILFFVLNSHYGLLGEAFGNNALTIPRIGAAFFDGPLSLNKKPWGLGHQWTFGTSYMHALNYRWWWLADTSFAIGPLSQAHLGFLSAFMGGAGIRYNILPDEFRPHVGLMIHYVHFLGENSKNLPLNLGWPIFVGLKPYIGLEWFIGSEIALLVEGGYGMYININEPFRQIYYANACAALYF